VTLAPHAASHAAPAAAPARLAASDTPDTLHGHLLARAAATPARVAIRRYDAARDEATPLLTWRAWADDALAVAALLARAGVAPGDVVAVCADNAPCWPVADLGALAAGAVVAGVYPTCTPAHLGAVLADCAARALVVDTAAQLDKARAVWATLPALALVVCADGAAAEAFGDARVVGWDAWLASGRRALADAAARAAVHARAAAVRADDVAALVYTSGSTGEPKGACLPHAYLVASAASVRDTLGLTDADSALSFLPYAHAAERVFGQATRVVCGMECALVSDAADTWRAARAYAPTLFGGLPRHYEKAHDAVLAGERAGVPAHETVAALFGPRLRRATSGGAPLPAASAARLAEAGCAVLGAYGQTEHLCVAMHRPGDRDVTSVGRPMPGTTVRIATADDAAHGEAVEGEILVRRSPLTFAGYRDRPEQTRAAFTPDGAWLRTGDLGALDADGRLHVTGRVREILALSTGRKVAPLPIEARLAEHPAVSHAVVVGEGRRYAAALLFLHDGASPDALAEHVARVNAALPPHERVVRHVALHHQLTVAGGDLTPTHKVRRPAVLARFAPEVEALYA
jgi:long-chain acyl-CoA synthetase